VLMAALLAAGTAAVAQEDPPARVGRVSDIAGQVFLAPDEAETSWQPIGINYPVTTGDSLWVGQDGRAEVDFGAGQFRLSDEANVHFSRVDDRQFSAYLASGRAILRLRLLDAGDAAKLDTANAQIDIVRPGSYRVDTTADGFYTSLVVRDGEAQLRIADRVTAVYAGQTAVIDGAAGTASLVVRDGYGGDSFDAWSGDRDRRWDGGGISSRYVSSYVAGINDLDEYGTWETTPTYGAVWYPRAVAADWVPYGDGRWTYVQPWGWTWVDTAVWGWAPFHYGRWVRLGSRWGWCPGAYVARPIYAPALVAWYGGAAGTGWSVSVGGPTFGWVPLAWGEPYWPQYRYGTEYWRQINRPYAVNVYRVPSRPLPTFSYANARIPGAVTAVHGDIFTGRRPIGGNRVPLPAAALAGAALTTAPLAVRPATRPFGADNVPRGIPAPAGRLLGSGVAVRPDYRAPGTFDGRPSTGQPGRDSNRFNEPRLNGGQAVVPSLRPAPSVRQPLPESAPTVGRPAAREPAPYTPSVNVAPPDNAPRRPGGRDLTPAPAPQQYNPGLNVQPTYMPPSRPAPPAVRESAPAPQQYNPGFTPAPVYVQPSRPAAPAVRESAPAPQQYNPGLAPAPTYSPAPQHLAPAPREISPAPAPLPMPTPIQVRPPPGGPATGARPPEPQLQPGPGPAPGPGVRPVGPNSGQLDDRGRGIPSRGVAPTA